MFTRSRRVAFLFAVLNAFTLTNTSWSAEEAGPATPKVEAAWLDKTGKPTPGTQRTLEAEWVWRNPTRDLLIGGPVLRYTMSLRMPEWSVARVESQGAEVANLVGSESGNGGSRFIVDMKERASTFRVYMVHRDGRTQSLQSSLVAKTPHPEVRIDKTCDAYEVKVTPLKNEAAALFLGIACQETEKELIVRAVRSNDSQWQTPDANPTQTLGVIPKPDAVPSAPLKVGVQDGQKRSSLFELTFAQKEQPKRWGISVGVSGTMYWYQETLRALKVRQEGITAKAGFSYQFIPRVFLSDFSIFGTVAAFDTSVPVPEAYYLGVNGRLGYRLPVNWLGMDYNIWAGWYLWTMFVKGDAYGVTSLSGPQLFLQIGHFRPRKLPFYLYGKFATVSDLSAFFQIENFEVAAGGGIGLWLSPSALMFTVDLAQTQFAKGRNSMNLQTVSLGLTYRF